MDNPYLRPSQFYESGLQQRVDNKTELLKGISLLELSLLIAIKQLVERETVTFNFEMVYDDYKDFMDMAVVRGSGGSSDGVSLRLYKKAVALKVKILGPIKFFCRSHYVRLIVTKEIAPCINVKQAFE